MKLHYQAHGNGPPLIILHGLLGSLDNWRAMGQRFAARYRVFALDLRNHGLSPHSEEMSYDAMAEELREFIDRQGLSSAAYLGHSIGGKIAMQFASRYPERVDKLIVVDIAPKDYPPSQPHLFNALMALDLSKHRSFLEAEKALAPAIPETAMRQFLVKNLMRDGAGALKWKINLDAIVRSYEGLLRRIALEGRCDKPACFIRGGRSSYIEDDDLPAIRRTFPQAEFVTLPDAGHWVHADAPEEFAQTVLNFLERS